MKKMYLFLILALLIVSTKVSAQTEDTKKNIEIIKKNLAESKAAMKKYEWIETTTTFLNGGQKGVTQKQCYYALDGKLTKVETGGSAEAKKPGGLRGKIAENKKAEMSDYAQKAIAKIQTYLPPDSQKIQKIYSDGKVAIQVLEPNKKFKLSFPDYNETGDLLAISLDMANQKIISITVSTSVNTPNEKVVFNITYSSLPDGTQYPGTTVLDAPAKNLKIEILNSGFKNAGVK
ncbi:hypothetical protein [Flavobacterium taihuense]|uniref:Outer membrane lipoprotein carrier protein LolA n=1 Tax=Flavobacterium taihuense TaxID=2857508 RepID=A0ABS6XXS5_9FLAO|nr:hypothetical protein [Flavobacterium taihuense]MBW4360694.1 hypothetical protein [Flavobacterium taihuense]